MEIITTPNDDGRRLDRVLRKYFNDLPLSAIYRLLRRGRIRVDGQRAAPESRIAAGSVIAINVQIDGGRSELRAEPPPVPESVHPNVKSSTTSVSTELNILRETDGWLILNKPVGIAVHGSGSLENIVRHYLADRIIASLSFKPGPLHRLDHGTSGVIVFSKSLAGAQIFCEAMRNGALRKRYLTVLDGTLDSAAVWSDTLVRDRVTRLTSVAGVDTHSVTLGEARTAVWPLAFGPSSTLALVEIGTGKTHQIRAQASAHSHPLSGDRKYGGTPRRDGFLLHSYELSIDPAYDTDGTSPIKASPPDDFIKYIRHHFGSNLADKLRDGLFSDELLRL